MSFLTEDYNDQILRKKNNPIAARAFEYLHSKSLIHAGSLIDRENVENAIGIEYKENSWNFLGPYLLLKNKIESEGYFITQKGVSAPGFRIINSEEMAEHAKNKIMHNLFSNFKTAYILSAHDVSSLTEDEKKKHKSVQHQAAQVSLMQQKMLFDASFF